jgi:DNA-binding MarR family transcriptional regulator
MRANTLLNASAFLECKKTTNCVGLSCAARMFLKFWGGSMTSKVQRKANGGFGLEEAPSYLMRRCQQLFGDLYARETNGRDLTRQQFMVLVALEHNDGVSQTALVEMTNIDRSTLAEMVRRMLDRGLLLRERTEEDARANAVAITPLGRKALKSARAASDRAERALLEVLPAAERGRFVKSLATIASAAGTFADGAEKPRRKLIRRQRF